MDKIEKELRKFSLRERRWIKEILSKLEMGDTKGVDIKKLRGQANIFRARKSGLRIIYQNKNGRIFILAIERRRESTYRFDD